jgi:hypothetical protein
MRGWLGRTGRRAPRSHDRAYPHWGSSRAGGDHSQGEVRLLAGSLRPTLRGLRRSGTAGRSVLDAGLRGVEPTRCAVHRAGQGRKDARAAIAVQLRLEVDQPEQAQFPAQSDVPGIMVSLIEVVPILSSGTAQR